MGSVLAGTDACTAPRNVLLQGNLVSWMPGTLDRLGAQLELAQLEVLRWDASVKAMQALARLEDALQTPVNSTQTAGAPGGVAETNPRAAKEQP